MTQGQSERAADLHLHKIPTGVDGFDEITGGGLPQQRTTLIIGNPGCGKTVFAMQILVNAIVQRNEPGVFVAFEENSHQLMVNAASFGWDLQTIQREKKLTLLDVELDPDIFRVGRFDMGGLLVQVAARAKEIGARWVVFDAVDVLLSLLDDPVAERQELFRLHNWLTEHDLTGIVTAKVEDTDLITTQRYGFIQFIADSVILLSHRLVDQISLRGLRVTKYRGSAISTNEFPIVIGSSGIEVARISKGITDFAISTERISTGVDALDEMFGGGYYRGTNILISGSPGTAKSTLASAFAEASCRRGERVLYVSFDENASELVRNMTSVNIQLQTSIEAGLLRVYSTRVEMTSAEELFMELRELIHDHQPQALIIDPLTALVNAGGQHVAYGVAQRLLYATKAQGITVVGTRLLETPDITSELTPTSIATVADTWIHLAYSIQDGQRNRTLTIIKSRGMHHSTRVHELELSDEGITLADVHPPLQQYD